MNREPLFECDGSCECAHEEDELRVFCGEILCRGCWEDAIWPNTVDAEPDWSDLPPFKSPHLTRNQGK